MLDYHVVSFPGKEGRKEGRKEGGAIILRDVICMYCICIRFSSALHGIIHKNVDLRIPENIFLGIHILDFNYI